MKHNPALLPVELRLLYIHLTKSMTPRLGEKQAKEIAWERANRLGAVWRRWEKDSKECPRCRHRVLWRHEGQRRVPLTIEGYAHGCSESPATSARSRGRSLGQSKTPRP